MLHDSYDHWSHLNFSWIDSMCSFNVVILIAFKLQSLHAWHKFSRTTFTCLFTCLLSKNSRGHCSHLYFSLSLHPYVLLDAFLSQTSRCQCMHTPSRHTYSFPPHVTIDCDYADCLRESSQKNKNYT